MTAQSKLNTCKEKAYRPSVKEWKFIDKHLLDKKPYFGIEKIYGMYSYLLQQ